MGLDASALLEGAVGKIVVRTNLAPPIVIEDPFGGGASQGPSPLLSLIRPKIEIYDSTGALLTAVAPAGEPSDVPLVPLLAVLAGVAVIAGILIASR